MFFDFETNIHSVSGSFYIGEYFRYVFAKGSSSFARGQLLIYFVAKVIVRPLERDINSRHRSRKLPAILQWPSLYGRKEIDYYQSMTNGRFFT